MAHSGDLYLWILSKGFTRGVAHLISPCAFSLHREGGGGGDIKGNLYTYARGVAHALYADILSDQS